MKTLNENEYHALRCLARFVIGVTFPHTQDAHKSEERWWIRASACKEIFEISYATLKKLTDKGYVERREVDGDYLASGIYHKVQYRISPEHFEGVYWDLVNERILATAEPTS